MGRMFEFIYEHDQDCDYRRTAVLGLEFECEHGHDVCPICDPCTCTRTRPVPQQLLDDVATHDWPVGSHRRICETTDGWGRGRE